MCCYVDLARVQHTWPLIVFLSLPVALGRREEATTLVTITMPYAAAAIHATKRGLLCSVDPSQAVAIIGFQIM
jgi:hypothetical protein